MKPTMASLTHRLLLEAPIGEDLELPRGGSSLEIPQVYDAVARDLLREARTGRVQIQLMEPPAAEDGVLIRRLVFRRLA